MKKLLLIALVGLLTVSAAAPAMALGPLDAEAELPLYSKYVWRGMVAVDDYVLQPSAALSIMGFKLGVWGNYNLTDINTTDVRDTKGEFTEINYTLGWGMSLPLLNFGFGLIYYDFPKLDDFSTSELYLSAKVNVILSPSLIIYQDLDAIKGGYWDLGIGHDFALGETSKLEMTAGLGLGSQSYFEGYFTGGGAFNPDTEFGTSAADARIGAALPFHPIPFLTVTPKVAWTTLLGDAKDAVDGNDALYYGKTDAFYWGLSAMFKF
jgi:hypothetical protein